MHVRKGYVLYESGSARGKQHNSSSKKIYTHMDSYSNTQVLFGLFLENSQDFTLAGQRSLSRAFSQESWYSFSWHRLHLGFAEEGYSSTKMKGWHSGAEARSWL